MKLEIRLPATKKFGKAPSFFLCYKINRSLWPLKGNGDLAAFTTRKTEKEGSRQAILIIATLAFIAILFFHFSSYRSETLNNPKEAEKLDL